MSIMKLTAKLRCSKVRYVEPVVSPGLLNSGAIYCLQVNSVNIKTITVACVASVSVRFRSKERGKRVKDRAKNGLSKRAGRGVGKKGRKLPSFPFPSAHFHFLALVSFLTRPKPKIPFLGLSLLRNQKETLATQATITAPYKCCSLKNRASY